MQNSTYQIKVINKFNKFISLIAILYFPFIFVIEQCSQHNSYQILMQVHLINVYWVPTMYKALSWALRSSKGESVPCQPLKNLHRARQDKIGFIHSLLNAQSNIMQARMWQSNNARLKISYQKNHRQGKPCGHYVEQDTGGILKPPTCTPSQYTTKAWKFYRLVKMFTSSKPCQPTCKSPSRPGWKHISDQSNFQKNRTE